MALPWRLLPRAGADLDRVVAFSKRQSPRAAHRTRARIADAPLLMSEHPRIGAEIRGGLRQFVIRLGRNAYVIRYRLAADEILVTRIWHGKENRPR